MIVNLVNATNNKFTAKKICHLIRCCSSQKSNASYWHNVGTTPLSYKTLGRCVDEAALQYGDREALVSLNEGLRYSFKDIRDQSDKLAAGLHSAGLKPGDRLGVWSPNCAHWYLTMMAAAKAGLVLVGIDPLSRTSEVEYCINKVGVKGLVSLREFKSQDFYGILTELTPELKHCEAGCLYSARLPSLKIIIIEDDKLARGTYKFKDIPVIATAETQNEISNIQGTIQPDAICNIQFTSGATEKSKAVCISHFILTNNSYFSGLRNELQSKHHKICMLSPLFGYFGTTATICSALQHGATLVIPAPDFDPTQSLQAISKEKCTIIHGAPSMYLDLITKQKEIQVSLDSVEIVVTGEEYCSPQVVKQILKELKVKEVRHIYGMTETIGAIFQTRPGDDIGKITDSVGCIQDHVEVKVVDDKGQVVPFGTPGELLVRGYPNMLGYWGDEKKTRETISQDRWLKTGDKFVLEEDGYGRILGRLGDIIIREGENIFSKEIEEFINTHPDVIESHVIGVPSESSGEEICAFVRMRNGTHLEQKKLEQFCTGKIACNKIPRYVMQVNAFSKTASGKIQKFKLKHLYARK